MLKAKDVKRVAKKCGADLVGIASMDRFEGKIVINTDQKVRAGEYTTLEFAYTVDSKGIAVGGGMEIIFHGRMPTNRWSVPQIINPELPGYVTASTKQKGDVIVFVQQEPQPGMVYGRCNIYYILTVIVRSELLLKGDVIKVIYGDTHWGSKGARAQILARKVKFPVIIDPDGKHKFLSYEDTFHHHQLDPNPHPLPSYSFNKIKKTATFIPSLRVVGNKAKKFHVVVPSILRTGEDFEAKISAIDEYSNQDRDYYGIIKISSSDPNITLSKEYTFTKKDQGLCRIKNVHFSSKGIHTITVTDISSRIIGVSNPSMVTKKEKKHHTYWGEIHAHSELSDGVGSLDEHYGYARNVAFLDFAAVSDHGIPNWNLTKEKAKQYHLPGRFVTFLGYEGGLCGYAHVNYYFFTDNAQPLNLNSSLKEIWEEVKKRNILAIPHHSGRKTEGMGTDWSKIDKRCVPVVEIFSAHGSSEYYNNPKPLLDQKKGNFVQDALKRGFKLGIIAGSDYHEALVGHMISLGKYPRNFMNDEFRYGTGLTAVLAKKLSRESIFEAIRKRHVYATTGERILLNFTLNGYMMGEEVDLGDDAEIKISGEVVGTEKIDKIEIVRDNKSIYIHKGSSQQERFVYLDKKNSWVDSSKELPSRTTSYYYLRVTQVDGEMAWSSPIWIIRVMRKELQ